ncbi:ribonuclease HI [Renibacterium salmoninarum ATCC 33209]|uniref:ribonuclease H n=1 Tax=Renibacterium salmoninarum (strain ATCC 33209 / DSM 20767 / JCM 11484 / NBRC 15589 / NCIMB 2235) TaxID=288705 RepID=A9WMA2_RENSM|nr:ribonuclease HI family protein [Renibacterium salmoninarum]ABY22234.1 ribonuclease HI [Renibacterium salmoninarum ATCC 33209]
MTITAAADGSALNNPGPAGWAWYIDEQTWRAGGWPHGTNNQGELMAVLDLFRATAHLPAEPLHILCDSQYVINCVTKWMPGWKRKGWRKADGKPVLNVEMLKEIDAALVRRTYQFEWVKGHAGHDLNEAADSKARAASTAYQNGAPPNSGPGFPCQTIPAESSSSPVVIVEEPDLFSILDDEPVEPDATTLLQGYDAELFGADISRAAVLLADEFEEVGVNGRIWDRFASTPDEATAPRRLEAASASIEGDIAVMIYRLDIQGSPAVQSSLWLRRTGQWRLRLRQTTLET